MKHIVATHHEYLKVELPVLGQRLNKVVSVHGARTSQNNYLLDGTDIMDALGRTAAGANGVVSGIESVQEFTVLTNTYSAEYGRAGGAGATRLQAAQ